MERTKPKPQTYELADQGRSGALYFLMSEDNVRRLAAIPWVGFGSDGEASAPEGVFL